MIDPWCAGGMGSLGSLMAMWLKQQGCMQLFLLGRSGRAAVDTPLDPNLFGSALVTMSRSDVAACEEAAYITHAAACTCPSTLQVRLHILY